MSAGCSGCKAAALQREPRSAEIAAIATLSTAYAAGGLGPVVELLCDAHHADLIFALGACGVVVVNEEDAEGGGAACADCGEVHPGAVGDPS